ncbi:PKD domain-containing protein [Flammeovirga yaeyamensis]|uniref:PKD domain-containing protein n=1 Tax=Flammeovirga yaeyamensis TaxID=367791 RepID=A0AAX1N9E9_9BACT|nr:PKD domain-containing protein [Flammeovirga yaeyamensis]MBB3699403.1 hypothetical protein [Flammeovirga yaeyamensis]NMF35338.1 hypothetical protein [Flammeovirga yaeyamensis]QWG04198.1 PKD domain-containing protein [Flammeovirga yaeyamensis]
MKFLKLNLFAAFNLLAFLFLQSCSNEKAIEELIGVVTVDAGEDQTVFLGDKVTLNGSATDSQNESINYLWEFTQIPSGVSSIEVENPTSSTTSFIPTATGTYILRLNAINSSGANDSDEISIVVESGTNSPEEIGGVLNSDRTLTNRIEDPTLPDYIASSDVILQANLTIEAGVKIVFVSESGIDVTSSAYLKAIGTAQEPIILTGVNQLVGAWKGLNIQSNNSNNILDYVEIDYAGQKGFDGANHKTNIMINDQSSISISNSKLTNGGGYGLYLREKTSNLTIFSNNIITLNATAVSAQFHHFHFFDETSDYTGNTNDYIEGMWSATHSDEDMTWNAINVPYKLAENIEVIESDIIIAAGTTIIGSNESGLQILAGGSLNAVGTASDIIIFRGEESLSGKWRGLSFHSNSTNNELTYVEISDAGQKGFDGGNEKANIMVDGDGRLKMTHTKSYNSAGYGLFTRTLTSVLVDFADNTLTENFAPVMTQVNHYHYFDNGSDYTGNTKDYIDSYWSGDETTINATWQALNVPYLLCDNIEYLASDINVDAGAVFHGRQESGIQVQEDGSLKTNGTSTDEIIFQGDQDVNGYWRGLRYLSNSSNNVIMHTIIKNGGQKGFDGGNRKANIEVGTSASLTIENSSISKSGDAGIRVQNGGQLSSTRNSFSGNTGVDIDQ